MFPLHYFNVPSWCLQGSAYFFSQRNETIPSSNTIHIGNTEKLSPYYLFAPHLPGLVRQKNTNCRSLALI